MEKIVCILCLSLLFTQTVSAAAVSLKGTVKDSAGTGIAGVQVSLAVNKSSATTDARGAFTLTGTGIRESRSSLKPLRRFTLAGNVLVVSPAFEDLRGYVEVFSGNGRKNASIPFSGTRAGKRSVVLPEFGPGLNIVRVTIGNQTVAQTLLCLGGADTYLKNGMSNAVARGDFQVNKLAAAATVDTLVAAKAGYTTARAPIDSYSKQDVAIVMREESAAGPMPLVYDTEHSGSGCVKQALAADPTTYPAVTSLPDPFLQADGTRIAAKAQWRCRRAEILEMIMKYETGQKPPKPEKLEATLSGNTINITCGVGSNTIKLSAAISRPSGAPSGPIPAIINKGSLQFDFAARGIATISFSFESQLTGAAMGGGYSDGNFYKLYPGTDAGYMIRWAWGVSRVIDALEMLPAANIDTKHLAVSGCSYGGKFALYSGTFDERIALTIPHESGGGGTISWRYSDMLEDRDKTEVENLHHAQGAAWYSKTLQKYAPTSVSPNTLPFDQHELMGLCLPRALFCIESSKIARMGAEAARLDAVAVRRMYSAFGITDRIGVSEANVEHCTWASSYTADLAAFVDKFLLGKNVDTNILRSKFTGVDTATWIPWTAPVLK